MKATCIEFTGTRAVVRLEPSWLARALGAREHVVELERDGSRWRGIASGRYADGYLPHGQRILNALDFREVVDLPAARARTA